MKRPILIAISSLFFFFTSAAPVWALAENPALKQGMTGGEVGALQQQLAEFGYYHDNIDGVFGSATKAAVIAFQADNGLEADGVVGALTVKSLHDYKTGGVAVSRANQSRRGQQLAAFAKQYLGVPYVWGGHSPAGFDCSGFIYYSLAHFGIDVPRMADEQFGIGQAINRRDLQVGDLVFFSTYEPGPSHVGIYIGNNQFIHASSAVGAVTITPMTKPYYVERYLGARRMWR